MRRQSGGRALSCYARGDASIVDAKRGSRANVRSSLASSAPVPARAVNVEGSGLRSAMLDE